MFGWRIPRPPDCLGEWPKSCCFTCSIPIQNGTRGTRQRSGEGYVRAVRYVNAVEALF